MLYLVNIFALVVQEPELVVVDHGRVECLHRPATALVVNEVQRLLNCDSANDLIH